MMAGVLQGLEEAQDRSMKISAARDDKRRKDEIYEIDKKMHLLKLDQAEMTGEVDKAYLEIERKKAKEMAKIYDGQSELDNMSISSEDKKNQEMMTNFRQMATKLQQTSQQGAIQEQAQQPEGSRVINSVMPQREKLYTPGKGFSYRNVSTAKSKGIAVEDKVIGTLESGGVFKDGAVEKFYDKDSAKAYVNQNLGTGWEKNYPKAKKIMDLNYGGIDILPLNINKTSEALKYLMENYELSQSDAANWLRKNDQRTIKVK